jgi:hypothetical protein
MARQCDPPGVVIKDDSTGFLGFAQSRQDVLAEANPGALAPVTAER